MIRGKLTRSLSGRNGSRIGASTTVGKFDGSSHLWKDKRRGLTYDGTDVRLDALCVDFYTIRCWRSVGGGSDFGVGGRCVVV